MKLKEVIGCSHTNCLCQCFLPGRRHIRSCDRCAHGWVAHAVAKVCGPASVCSGQVEIVQSSVVFDISSLILYGTQALPVRMKILLDRLFSVLTHTQVLSIIHTLGWTLRDYVRGYMLQDPSGTVLDRWVCMSAEDEAVTLRQFLRFGETKSIVELMEEETRAEPEPRAEERGPRESPRQHGTHAFEDLPGGHIALLQPFSYSLECSAPDPLRGRRTRSRRAAPQAQSPSAGPERQISSSSAVGKGRVSCHACAKSFYDKGTLKIHFNAVHLKIKHRCTVAGCSMTFSSLRSRNRHSNNPNPRLHSAGPLRHADPAADRLTHALTHPAASPSARSDTTDLTPKKKSRKSSTPLKIWPENHHDNCSDDESYRGTSQRQPSHSLHGNQVAINSLHGNRMPIAAIRYNCKYSYRSNGHMEEKNGWTTGEIAGARDRCRPPVKVKEELGDPACRGHHSNLCL